VTFYPAEGKNLSFRSDAKGVIHTDEAPEGVYRVVIVQDERRTELKRVTIDFYGIHPSTFVVPW